jgi:hypothetical protein
MMKNECNKCDSCSPYGENKVYCIECGDGTPCFVKYSSNCAIYKGDDLECFGIISGTTLTDVLINLLEVVFPECGPTTTTTSTTTVYITTTTSTTSTTTSTSTSTTTTTTVYVPTTTTTTQFKICDTCP